MDLVASLLIAVVAAAVSATVTARSFYSQKWWEKKAEVYSNILETLGDLVAQEDAELNVRSQGWSFN